MFDLSLVIACYRDAPHLERNVRIIRQVLDGLKCVTEWIFVEDASQDGTIEILERIRSEQLPEARVILHERNRGRGRTVRDGFAVARGRVAGFLDIDLAVAPVYIPAMMQAILIDGFDVATARRIYRNSLHPGSLVRDLASASYRAFSRRYLGLPYLDTETGYKFFRRDVLPALEERCEHDGWFWDTEVMAQAFLLGLKVVEIPCVYRRDMDKASTVHLAKDTIEYLNYLRAFRRRHGASLEEAARGVRRP